MPDGYVTERNEETLRKRELMVRKQVAAATSSRRRGDLVKAALITGLASGLAYTVEENGKLADKLATRDVVYAVIQGNGEVIASTHYSEVPPAAKQQEQIANALWTYIQARDCYGSSSPLRQYYISQAMSDMRVGRQVHEQFDVKNPMAPQHIYGEHNITVQCEMVDPPTPIGDLENNQYLFRFRRWEQKESIFSAQDQANAPFYAVTVRFRTGVYPTEDEDKKRAWLDRNTFNAPGVQIVDYPGAKPTNASPQTKMVPIISGASK